MLSFVLLIIGGFERVFEIGKCFRNEDLSNRHNPEFTSCEMYTAYCNYSHLMDFTSSIFAQLLEVATGSTVLKLEDLSLFDLKQSFAKLDVITEIEAYFGTKICLDDSFEQQIDNLFEKFENKEPGDYSTTNKRLEKLIEWIIEPKCVEPTFIINHPALISPLAKRQNDQPALTERFELFVNRIEIANGYSEQNDWREQLESFNSQLKGENQAVDLAFVEALEHGLPPTAGVGLGIDRFVMLITGQRNIKDVILFPMTNAKSDN